MVRKTYVKDIIQRFECYAIVNIACGNMNAQNNAVFITSGVSFVGKTPFVLAFNEDAAIWISGRNGAFFFFLWWIIIEVKRLFTMLFTVFVDFLLQLLGISFSFSRNNLLGLLSHVSVGLNMGAIDKYGVAI